MFRRNSPEPDPATADEHASSAGKTGGKGRPTPTRREAEAAARARAKVPRTKQEIRAANREARKVNSTKMRQAMRDGDEKYLPARDRGPVRRFIRDWIDHRLMFLEMLIPGLLVSFVLGYSGKPSLMAMGNSIMLGLLLLAIFDIFMTRMRLRRELAKRFPGQSTKGATYYAVMRAMQVRFLRLPKPQVKLGQALPEHYR